jgi:hypothetical protein
MRDHITTEVKQRFQLGYKKFYEGQEGATLRHAYAKTIETYFCIAYELHDGSLLPVLPSASELPTFDWVTNTCHTKPVLVETA